MQQFQKDISFGSGGALSTEIRSIINDRPVACFIGGLGGRDITLDDVKIMFDEIKKKSTETRWIGSKIKK